MIILILILFFVIVLALACLAVTVLGGLAIIALWVLLVGSFLSMLMKRTWDSLFLFLLLLNTCFGTPYRVDFYLVLGVTWLFTWYMTHTVPIEKEPAGVALPKSTRYLTPDPRG